MSPPLLRLATLLLLFLAWGPGALGQTPRWQVVDGFQTALLFVPGKAAPEKKLDLHQNIILHGPALPGGLERGRILFRRLGDKSGGTAVKLNPRAPFGGCRAVSFEVPLLPVGRYRILLVRDVDTVCLGQVAIPAFRCYFNRPGDPRQARTLEDIVPAVDLPRVMALYMDRARQSLDIAMSDFDHPLWVDAVVRAMGRGVRVRFISDERAADGEPAARRRLKEANVPFITNGRDPGDDAIMHHKFMIVDDFIVLVGHAKGNMHHTRVNQSLLCAVGRPLAAIYREEFQQMWGGPGMESPAEGRRFNTEKALPWHRTCQMETLDGTSRVDVAFSPDQKPSGAVTTRHLNLLLAILIQRAQSDIGFLASGFGDTDLGHVLREATRQRGVMFYGVQGDPDWHFVHNELVQQFQGLGPKGWVPPADVVGSHEMNEAGVWQNVHNRVMVMDVFDDRQTPVACFSSGAWRSGLIRDDDSMVCVHNRRLAEQLVQHIGGTRSRAFRPLPHRNRRPRLEEHRGRLEVESGALVRLLGGRVAQTPRGGVALRLGKRTLYSGDVAGLSLTTNSQVMPRPRGRELFLPLDSLAFLGTGLQVREGRPVIRGLNGLEVPLDVAPSPALKIAASLGLREGERWSRGLVVLPEGPRAGAGAKTQPVPKSAVDLLDKDGFLVLKSRPPALTVASDASRPIRVLPGFLLALDSALLSWQRGWPGKAPVRVVDGTNPVGGRARGVARKIWRSRPGAGVVLQIPRSFLSDGGLSWLEALLEALMKEGMTRINIDMGLLGGHSVRDFLHLKEKSLWRPMAKPGLYQSRNRRTLVFLGEVGERLIEVEKGLWDFRGSLPRDLSGPGTSPGAGALPGKGVAKSGELRVTLPNSSGAVWLDGKMAGILRAGESLVLPAETGLHELVVSRPGCHDHVSTLHLRAGVQRRILVFLKPLRQYAAWSPSRRRVPAGMVARGAITAQSPGAADLVESMGITADLMWPGARAVRMDLVETPQTPFTVNVAAFGSRLHVMIVNDRGELVAEDRAQSWSTKLKVTPEKKRSYSVILAQSAPDKSAAFDLVRCTLCWSVR